MSVIVNVSTSGATWSTVSVVSLTVPVVALPDVSVIVALNCNTSDSPKPATPSNTPPATLIVLLVFTADIVLGVSNGTKLPPPSVLTNNCTVPPLILESSAIGTVMSTPVFPEFQ